MVKFNEIMKIDQEDKHEGKTLEAPFGVSQAVWRKPNGVSSICRNHFYSDENRLQL